MAFNTPKRRTNSDRSNSGTENLVVRLKSVHLVDTKAAAERRAVKPHADDYAIVQLMHSGVGIEAQFDEDGVPLTEVKVKLREHNITGENKPYVIADFVKGQRKGTGPKMGDNPIMMLEGCWKDRNTGDISTGWLQCIKPDSDPSMQASLEGKFDHVIPNVFVSVKEEKLVDDRNNPGQKRPRQDRFAYLTDFAEQITDIESLKASTVSDWLYSYDDIGGGQPSLLLRLSQLDGTDAEPTKPEGMALFTIYGGQVNEQGEPKSKEEMIDSALEAAVEKDETEDKQTNFKFYLENLQSETNYIIEAIPVWRYSTGPKSLPSAMKPGRRPDHANFRAVVINDDGVVATREKDGVTEDVMGQFISRGHLVIKRGDFQDGPGRWYATSTNTLKNGTANEHYSLMDLPAASTPEALKQSFAEKAAARSAYAQSKLNERKAAKNADSIPEDAIPDQSNGLTPNR